MRVFKNKWFATFAGKSGLTDKVLGKAIEDAGNGLIDADLAAA